MRRANRDFRHEHQKSPRFRLTTFLPSSFFLLTLPGNLTETIIVDRLTFSANGSNLIAAETAGPPVPGNISNSRLYQTVLTHELGHAIGLGNSSDNSSAMHTSLAAGVTRRGLTPYDLSQLTAGGYADVETDGVGEPSFAFFGINWAFPISQKSDFAPFSILATELLPNFHVPSSRRNVLHVHRVSNSSRAAMDVR